MSKSAYIALGSNLGNQEENLRLAAGELQQISKSPLIASSIWWSLPEGFDETVAEFCNAVVCITVEITAEELLAQLKAIERKLGRERTKSQGYQSRTIDLDIIGYDDLVLDTGDLEVPHPRAMARRFVLVPLQEICPEYRFPGLPGNLTKLIENAPDNPMRRSTPLIPLV